MSIKTKILTLLLAFCVAFSGLPFLAGNLEAHAATKTKITLKAKATGKTTASLSWNKIKKPQKGYAVFRDGKPIAHLGKKLKYSDKKLSPGTSYQYQIKVYKTKKKTQWYNKKTKKWTTKKPAKKYRGKSRKKITYTYLSPSNKVTVKTEAETVPEETVPEETFQITWKNWDGTVLLREELKKGATPSYKGTPTKPDDSNYTYTFKGWDPAVTAATKDATYTAQFKVTAKSAAEKYKIIWENYNGQVLKTEHLEKGTMPSYSGTPTQPEDENNTYVFTGWTPEVEAVTGPATYLAVFKAVPKPKYTITWKNYDGAELLKEELKKGVTPQYTGPTPSKPDDSNYTYAFSGWSPAITAVSKSCEYTAQFTATPKPKYNYEIKFINEPYGNGGETAIYIKTDNPSEFGLHLSGTDKNGNTVFDNLTGKSKLYDYADIETVKGGYIAIAGPTNTGAITFNVYEDRIEGVSITSKKVCSKTVNVRDYAAEEKAWRQSVINKVTTPSMSNIEKMNTICKYILDNFKYYPNYNGQYCFEYLTTRSVPYWIKKEADSNLSPAVLVDFGNDLNYPLENLFPKYEPGTAEWTQFHMCAYSASDDYYFRACPPSTTNRVNPEDIIMFDPDTFKFWGE